MRGNGVPFEIRGILPKVKEDRTEVTGDYGLKGVDGGLEGREVWTVTLIKFQEIT